ncbi:UNVERIFIED_CONTAM: hypothetical protein Slati_2807000 [Sesamum latifolium]|uniref:Retrotransposon gag domain-containing protein n=1 Tax=Sesamum latifolium TaxID=2727402 RepID=A0AAW2VAV2_9LAMI
MQTRSRARDLEANEEVMQEQNQGNREDLPTRGGGSLNQPPQTERGQGEARREGEARPPLAPQPPLISLTPEALQRMIEEASARAAERAIERFIANSQREPSPPRYPRRGRGTPSAPEDNESRENGPQDMSIEEQHGSQASPPRAPPQGRREEGDRLDRRGRREKEAISNRREDVSRTRNESQRQGATQDPLPLAVAPARKSPFSMQILAEALPQGIRIPSLTEYDGTGDPEDHLEKFLAKADFLDMSNTGYCKIFCTTLSGKAMAWSKKAYRTRTSEAVLEVPHLNHELLASILQQGLRRGRFRESIAGKPQTTLDELLKRAAKYICIEEALKPKVDTGNKRKTREGERKDPRREGLAEGQRHMPPEGFAKYTPLKAPRAAILAVAEQQGLVQWPRKMKDNPKRLKSDKYCRFHKDRGHNIEDCYHLKNEIEKLIQRGYLREYVESNPSGNNTTPRRGGSLKKRKAQGEEKREEKTSPLRSNRRGDWRASWWGLGPRT